MIAKHRLGVTCSSSWGWRIITGFWYHGQATESLNRKKTAFSWNDACQHAFDELRKCLTTSPILAYPDYSKRFILDTDARNYGIGAVLSQISDDGSECVIAYASRYLSRREQRYCVTQRELLAIMKFVQHFRQYLLGRQFTLRTDHGSLVWVRVSWHDGSRDWRNMTSQ